MAKIVIIGAGSHVFSRHLIVDFISYPELRDSTITLMDIDPEHLNLITAFAGKLVKQHGLKTRIESTTDRREALESADYVIVTIRVGGDEANNLDIQIPAKYGVRQGVGDTTGPGGIFYGLRHIPVLLDICRDMEELCPDAWLINYTNPMAMICWAINDYTHVKNVGLCHSVQGTAADLARYLGVPLDEISYWVAGINHMAWFLELNGAGETPILFLGRSSRIQRSIRGLMRTGLDPDIVRVEIFKAFGYFNTESTQHMSEYVPYFRKQPELFEKDELVFHLREKIEMQRRPIQDEQMRRLLESEQEIPIHRSREYCSYTIHSIETGIPRQINGNVRNTGLITNLPQGSCVEVPCLVDKTAFILATSVTCLLNAQP